MIEVAGICLPVVSDSKAFPTLVKASLQLFPSIEYDYTVMNDGMIVSRFFTINDL